MDVKPSRRLATHAFRNCASAAAMVNADDGENEEAYLGTVAMAETAQSFAYWWDVLHRCMRAGFHPRHWTKR